MVELSRKLTSIFRRTTTIITDEMNIRSVFLESELGEMCIES